MALGRLLPDTLPGLCAIPSEIRRLARAKTSDPKTACSASESVTTLRRVRGKVMISWFDVPTFAASVRTRRGQRSLREASAEIGTVSPSTLSRIERSAVPDLETFLRLCQYGTKRLSLSNCHTITYH
jgi:hypothetical protein